MDGDAAERIRVRGLTGFLEKFDALQTAAGGRDATLDLNLWAEATRDNELAEMVHESCEAFRAQGLVWADLAGTFLLSIVAGLCAFYVGGDKTLESLDLELVQGGGGP